MADDLEGFEEEEAPLTEEEIEALQQDIRDVETLKDLLGARGLKGVVFFCPDCNEDHYLAWDLLKGNLSELLQQGESLIHEPAFDPNPDEYVTWDYATGYLDGYETYRAEDFELIGNILIDELMKRDIPPSEIRVVLERAGLHPGGEEES